MTEQDSDGRVVGFHKPGAERRIRDAAEAGLKAAFPFLLDRHGQLNEAEIEGAFCAMIRGHFEYMVQQEGLEPTRQLFAQFETALHESVHAMFEQGSAD